MKIPLHTHKSFGSKNESVGHYRKHTIGELGSSGLLIVFAYYERKIIVFAMS